MPVFPIPNDWAGEEWACVIIEWPDSPRWMGLLRGLITTPVRGRFWDGQTGSISDAQAIGLEIEERNPVTSCNDIVVALGEIKTAILGIKVNSDTQVTIQTNIVTQITAVATAVSASIAASQAASQSIASSFAWAEALAQSFASVKVWNNVEMQIRLLEPGVTPPPAAEEETPTGISNTTQDMSSAEMCKRAFWVAYSGKRTFEKLLQIDDWLYFTVLGAVGALGDVIGEVANLVAGGSRIGIIPASILQQVAHMISRLQDNNEITIALTGIVDGLSDVDEVACNIWDLMDNLASTQAIQDYVLGRIISVGGINAEQASLALLSFNLNTLGALYYDSPLLGPAPAVLAGFDATCQGCLE